jgi:Na+/proline symporter
MSDRAKLLAARAGVVVFGLVAYALALGAESIFELVQTANGIGSGGIFVLVIFGLFSGFGGKWAAVSCLTTGTLVWAVLTYAVESFAAPYLVSLAAAFLVYLVVAAFERRRPAPTA